MTTSAQPTNEANLWRSIQDGEVREGLILWRFTGVPGERGATGQLVRVVSVNLDGTRVRIRADKIDAIVDRARLTGQMESEYHYLVPAQRPVELAT